MVSSTAASLNAQYYEGLASDAAESGATHADVCLAANSYTSTWGTKTLTPKTDCNGNNVAAQPTYVLSTSRYTSTYTVDPVVNAGTGSQTAKITGTVNLLRTSGAVWKTYTKTLVIKTGGQVSTNQVVFGYDGSGGPFFATVGADGVMRGVGYNGLGALGDGTFDNTRVPVTFSAPTVNPIVAGFTSFLSVGFRMYALDSAGRAYGAGSNAYGALGTGIAGDTSSNRASPTAVPAQVSIPGNKPIRNIVIGQSNTYFITTDNYIYAAGRCTNGRLGTNYTISSCAHVATPQQVALPTPTSDPNTIPTDNLVSDAGATYIRMAGGRVYGWGSNSYGQMGNETFTDTSIPVKIGTYGDTGKPAATQIVTDGDTLYVLDSAGNVNSFGYNHLGQMGNSTSSFKMYRQAGDGTYTCFRATSTVFSLATCTGAANQKFQIRSDGTLYNSSVNRCVENTASNGVDLAMATCSSSNAQKFVWDESERRLSHPQSGKCIDNQNGDLVTLYLSTCVSNTINQTITNYNGTPTKFDPDGLAGSVKKIWTDQWSLTVLTTDGEIWSAGTNESGFFGNGTTARYQSTPVKFNMPTTADDAYQASYGGIVQYQNIFAIGTNGKVYGAGGNAYGQLGNGSTSTYESTPVEMSVIDGTNLHAAQVQTGMSTTVVYMTNGSVYTVGRNNYGQLGDGTLTTRTTPIKAQYVNDLKSATF